MKLFNFLICITLVSMKSYGNLNPVLKCWDYPDKYHPKLTINKTIDGYELELISLLDVQAIAEQLYPEKNNSFAERLVVKLKNCDFSTSQKNILTCLLPYDVSYYDWGGKLMNQSAFDDDSKVSYLGTSYKTEESTRGKVDWISLNIRLVSKTQKAIREINFYSNPLCKIN